MENLIEEAIAGLDRRLASMRALSNDTKAGKERVENIVQQSLYDLHKPLSMLEDSLLLESDGSSIAVGLSGGESEVGTEDDTVTEAGAGDQTIPDASEDNDAKGGETVFEAGDEHVYAWEYLGREYSEWIIMLHGLPQLERLPKVICAELHPWQSSGANKLVCMAASSFKGGILADEMGLGKTLTAITTGEELKELYPGAFNVVIAPKSCAVQWEEEIISNTYPPSRVKILDDGNTTVNELLDGKYDWIICSYQFALSRWTKLEAYETELRALSPRTKSKAKASFYFATHTSHMSHRPSAPLHSPVYTLMGLPIRGLFLDEAQAIKNEDSRTYEAIKAIPAQFCFILTGTIFPNRWSDVYALVTFLRGHPFKSRDAFQRAFAKSAGRSTITVPSKTKRARLIKFLQACVVARPGSVLELPDLTEHHEEFWIVDQEVTKVIMYLIQQFYDALSRNQTSATSVISRTAVNDGGKGGMWTEKAIYCINLAQVLANNQFMLSPPVKTYYDMIKENAIKWADKFVERFDKAEPGSSAFYFAVMEHMDLTFSARKRTGKGEKGGPRKRARPDPEAAVEMASQHGDSLRTRMAVGKTQPPKDANKSPDDDDESPDESLDDDDNVARVPFADREYRPGRSEDEESLVVESEIELEEGVLPGSAMAPDTSLRGLSENEAHEANIDMDKKLSDAEELKEWRAKVKGMSKQQIMSPRISKIVQIVETIRKGHPGEKVLVFSKFRKILDVLERAIEDFGLVKKPKVLRFDGTVNPSLRQGVREEFARAQTDQGQIVLMLLTCGCGGAGLNLASASHVILTEPWWRDSDEKQAIARAFRQGQTKDVHVWRITGVDSVVDHLLQRLRKKKAAVSDEIMGELSRPDGVAPVIPDQWKRGAGEYSSTRK